LDIGTAVLLHSLSRTSLDPGFHPQFLAMAACMRFCQAVLFLSLGLAFSFLRRFGWLAAGLLFWSYLLSREQWPVVRLFDVVSITQPVLEGRQWQVPWKPLLAQAGLAGGLLLLAYVQFLGAGDRMLRSLQRLPHFRLGRVLLLAGAALVVVVGLGLGFYLVRYETGEDFGEDVKITYPTWSTSRTRTEHYEFLYPNNLAERAQSVVAGADGAHDKVAKFLDAQPQSRIVADMTEPSVHHAGRAYWKKIRMDLTAAEDAETLLAILGHETAHVYLDQISDSRLSDQFQSTRFFHEGVASYVEYRLFRKPEDLDTFWSVAAVMRARRQVDFAELVDDDRLQARFGPEVAYPLGDIFVESLVQCYGRQAVGQVARSLAREKAPQDLSGLELWRDMFQACGFSLEKVQTAFYARLDDQAARQRDLIARLPRLRAAVHINGDLVEVEAFGPPIEGWTVVCRFRQAEDTPDREYVSGVPQADNRFWTFRDLFPTATCWYRLGLTDGQTRVIYEPWQRATLRP
jgi:hypothetical protein